MVATHRLLKVHADLPACIFDSTMKMAATQLILKVHADLRACIFEWPKADACLCAFVSSFRKVHAHRRACIFDDYVVER